MKTRTNVSGVSIVINFVAIGVSLLAGALST